MCLPHDEHPSIELLPTAHARRVARRFYRASARWSSARLAVCLAVVLAACGGASARDDEVAGREARHTCDPFVEERPTEVPRAQTIDATCGNGHAEEHAVSCLERCPHSCGRGDDGCETVCMRAEEACDGADLRGETCASIGFGGGTLACRDGCAWRDLAGCSACVGSECRELAIAPPLAPTDGDVRLVGRGRAVRAFWSATIDGDPHLVSAAIGPGASLAGDPIDLGLESTRDVVATSTSWIAIVAEDDALVIRTIDARGNVGSAPLGLPAMFSGLELLAVPSLDGVLVSTGEFESNPSHLVLLDRRGEIVPLPRGAVHAISGRDRIAIAPLGEAPTALAVSGGESIELEPRAGDRLVAWIHVADSCAGGDWCWGGAALLRDGTVVLPYAGSAGLDPPALEVTVAGAPRISFAPDGDAIDRTRFDLPDVVVGDHAPFAPIVPLEAIARARDVRAAFFDPDADGPEPGRFVLGRLGSP